MQVEVFYLTLTEVLGNRLLFLAVPSHSLSRKIPLDFDPIGSTA